MPFETSSKVTADHLKKKAVLYIRQSTIRQTREHRESLDRQYAFREAALKLGWSKEQVDVIDCDLGRSGALAQNREGFQKLVGEVNLGRVGIVMALEVSRLARKCSDWYRLVENCAATGALLMDEDGLYDPGGVNDKIVLGMKGTLSEIELHLLSARMRGGLLNKAKRGELKKPLPIGFVYDDENKIRLNPDAQVQEAVRLFFKTYRRIGTVFGTVKHFCDKGILFPMRPLAGPRDQAARWERLKLPHARRMLVNPHYAGCYSYGRLRVRRKPDGRVVFERLPKEQWTAFIKDAHEAYISYEDFENNQKRLAEHCTRRGAHAPREGAALLQGLVVCASCGSRMQAGYRNQAGRPSFHYVCPRNAPTDMTRGCQSMLGGEIDKAVSDLLLEVVSPLNLELSLAVQEELQARALEVDGLRSQQVERARYDAELARRRYMSVDPDNRLVAAGLESDWNEKLEEMERAKRIHEEQRRADGMVFDEEKRARVLALASDFPRLWKDPNTPMRERKRLLRLLIEDVTLLKENGEIAIHLRFRGGATRSLSVPAPILFGQTNATAPEVLLEIDRLLETHCEDEAVELLNEKGMKSGSGLSFDLTRLTSMRRRHGMKSHFERLQERGMLTANELAQAIGLMPDTVRKRRRKGLIQGMRARSDGQYLYEPPEKPKRKTTKTQNEENLSKRDKQGI